MLLKIYFLIIGGGEIGWPSLWSNVLHLALSTARSGLLQKQQNGL